MSTLISVNVGRPQDIVWKGKTIRTSIWKSPVKGRATVRRTNIEGDEQSDLEGHGGEQRAVLVYQLSSYRYWSEKLKRDDFEHGQFGENLTVDGLEDAEVCIGDRFRIGTAIFEVSQPRVTCYRLGIRMNHQELPALLVAHGRPGFYMRVIQEGEIGAGDSIEKLASGPEGMNIAEIDALLYKAEHPSDRLARALQIPALSPGWKSSFKALLDANLKSNGKVDGNAGLVPVDDSTVLWNGFRRVRVVQSCAESEDVRSFLVESVDGEPLPDARPGQHIAVKLELDTNGETVTRLYSLSGPQGTGRYRFSVKREASGEASGYLHRSVRVGSILEISAPRGSFTLADGDGSVVLVSAGVGVTPMMAMLSSLATKKDTTRPVWWFHGARDGQHHAFRREVEELLGKMPSARLHVLYSHPAEADIVGDGFEGAGHLSVAGFQELGVPQAADYYLCGPPQFLSDFQKELRAWGVVADRVHAEVFGTTTSPAAAFAPKTAPHLPPGDQGQGPPTVRFVRSGLAVKWSARYQSLLELAEACDVPTRWSCRTGVCHSCQSSLIDGDVAYMPPPLSPPANGTVLLCCAQPKADIQLDL